LKLLTFVYIAGVLGAVVHFVYLLPFSEILYKYYDSIRVVLEPISILAYIIAGLVFIKWLYRVYSNLPTLGAEDLHFKPRWAILGVFIPIANVVVPYWLVEDTWKASKNINNSNESSASWRSEETPSFIKTWWLLYLIYYLNIPFYLLLVGYAMEVNNLEKYYLFASLLSFSVLAYGAKVTKRVISEIEERQSETYKHLEVKDIFTRKAVCPSCGAELRTKHSKQCPSCFLNWRDSKEPKYNDGRPYTEGGFA
jgi:hypothetical protein